MDRYRTSDLGRRLASVLNAGEDFGHPMMASPGVPAEKVKLLRDAYAKTLRDPELLVDVKKQEYDFDPVSGDELQTLAKTVINQPAQVIERLKKILGN
jgi:tripartite-type tricarboxylate transporter receptor subunit TctC